MCGREEHSVIGPVTVVIPARNASATLRAQLEALELQRGSVSFSVMVVDNGSIDGTADVARSFPANRFDLEVVHEPEPGINNARNRGIDSAREGLILLCDADDIVDEGWVEAMALAAADDTWLAGVVDYVPLNSERTRKEWGAPERSTCSAPVPFVDRTFGCNCGFSRTMWQSIGRFDARLSGIGGDETEFFMRAYAVGYQQRWVPEALVAYRLRSGIRNMCRQRFRQGRNQVRMSRLPGGRVGPPFPSGPATLLSICKLALAAPKYARSSATRTEWLGAASRHVGRLAGHRSRWPN